MNKKLRVIVTNLGFGGTERHLSLILPALTQRGWEIDLFCLNRTVDLAPVLRAGGVRVHFPKRFGKAGALCQLFRSFLSDRTTLTHFFLPHAYVLGMVVKCITFNRAPSVMSRRSLNNYQKKIPAFQAIETRLHRFQKKVLANARAVAEQLSQQESVPPSNIKIIHNGIDFKKFSKSPPRQGLSLVMVANLIPYKGHRDLLQALAGIRDRLPQPWTLTCAGKANSPAYAQELRQMAAEKGLEQNVRWLGTHTQVENLLASADIGLLCSHEEGFSNAILEYMAASLPVVATDAGGNAECVQHGRTGLIVPPQAPDRLGEAIVSLALSPDTRHAFGHAGRARVEEFFSLEKCVTDYDDLYTSLQTSP